jgi:hypothetical protein
MARNGVARRPGYRRAWVWVLALLLLLGVGVRLALGPLAERATRRFLNSSPGLKGDFSELSVSVFPLAFSLADLRLYEEPAPPGTPPLLSAQQVRGRLDAGRLLRGELVLTGRVDRPKLTYVLREAVKEQVEETAQRLQEPGRKLVNLLRHAPPLRYERLELRNGALLVVDAREKGDPGVLTHDVEATVENMASRAGLSDGRPLVLAASGTVQRTGAFSLFLTADPFQPQPTFAGRMMLRDQQLADFNRLVGAKTGVRTEKGQFDLSALFVAREGRVQGSIKPELRNVDVAPANDDLGSKVKAALGDIGIELAQDKGEQGPKKIATVVPIDGRIDAPDIGLGAAVAGVMRNAVSDGLDAGFDGLRAGGSGTGGSGKAKDEGKKGEKKRGKD